MSLQIKTSLLENVDGSCELSTSNSKVIVSVTGPIEPKQRQELPQQLALEIIIKPSIGIGPTTREVLLQDKLSQVLQGTLCNYMYPRKLLQLTFQILENPFDNNNASGTNSLQNVNPVLSSMCDLNSCINSVFLGILDAGVGLKSSFVSTLIGIHSSSDNALINIDEQSIQVLQSDVSLFKSLHLVVMEIVDHKCSNILLLDSSGTFTDQDLLNVLQKSEKNCLDTFSSFRTVVKSKVEKDFIWKDL